MSLLALWPHRKELPPIRESQVILRLYVYNSSDTLDSQRLSLRIELLSLSLTCFLAPPFRTHSPFLLNMPHDRSGDINPCRLLNPFKPGRAIDFDHHGALRALHHIYTRDI